jgi:bifunctional N-acetylglucosamine-1-phosphate-uridyltransferase/glucosamine-1-phosphate-acetyltransferase GlmU-like protein
MHPLTSCIAPTRPNNVSKDSLTIIILAANIGYGMKSYGPKSLLCINNKETLLEYQINIIKTVFPNADIILVVGFCADKIIRKCPKGVRIVENQLFETSSEVEQIRLALNCTLTERILIIKDDIVFNNETFFEITKDKSCIIYESKSQIDSSNVGVTIANNCAQIFSYDIPTKWCHIAYLTNKEFKMLKNLCNNRERSRMYLFEVLNIILNKVGQIKAMEPKNMEIVKIDTSRNLAQLKEE